MTEKKHPKLRATGIFSGFGSSGGIGGDYLRSQGSANATLPELLSAGYIHSVYLYRESQELYTAYISVQGAPFSDPAFSAPELQLSGLPTAVISYSVWRALSPAQRLGELALAYRALCEFLLLASDDQTGLGRAELGARLATMRSQLLALTMSARAALALLRSGTEGRAQLAGELQGLAASDPLSGAAASAGDWSRKVRGFVVARDLCAWLARSVRDFYLLKTQLP
ncbi:cardiotrophin-like cytokine factor 1 [Petromyzon marinus]|uniref:Cardiotrophin-2-like n=1 Tax=Petromyzon marinus TaxID=7757 RepID=A0AAJ7WM45_PETMA|nr:cardiotrophin-2-like [Petromyzon marinus]